MDDSKRVVINTFAQYGRTVFNMLLSLYTVRLVLNILGADDYGIYTIVAGVTSMLAFMTNALTSTTQRFMSFYQGRKDLNKMKEVFNNSELLHIFIGLSFIIVLLSLKSFLFNGFLNIPIERISAAESVYIIVIAILFTTFCSAPFRALLISHENIVYISIIDVLDGINKVILVSILPFVPYDKLILYGFILLANQIFNFFAFSLYSFKKYPECILPRLSLFSKSYIRELLAYAGWVIYGMGCIIGRSQGIALIINRFLSTVANAAYGLAFQISSAVSTVSTAFLNAMRPQIIKSEGSGNRNRTLKLSSTLCKFSFFLMSLLCIPCVFEIDQLLKLWLNQVPQYTVLFARMALIAGMVDTLTLGLSVTNEAVGNIKYYNIIISTTKLLTLPLVWCCLYLQMDPFWIAAMYVFVEFISAFIRIPFVKSTAGLNVPTFLQKVILREIVPVSICVLTCYLLTTYVNLNLRFIITFLSSFIIYGIAIYVLGLTSEEKELLKQMLKKIKN